MLDPTLTADGRGINSLTGSGFRVSVRQNVSGKLYAWYVLRRTSGAIAVLPYTGGAGDHPWVTSGSLVMASQSVGISYYHPSLGESSLVENRDFVIQADTPSAGMMTLQPWGLWSMGSGSGTTSTPWLGSFANVQSITSIDGSVEYTEGTHYSRSVSGAGETTLTQISGLPSDVMIRGTLGSLVGGGGVSTAVVFVAGALDTALSQDVTGAGFTPVTGWAVPAPLPALTRTVRYPVNFEDLESIYHSSQDIDTEYSAGQSVLLPWAYPDVDNAITARLADGIRVGGGWGVNDQDDRYDAIVFGDAPPAGRAWGAIL